MSNAKTSIQICKNFIPQRQATFNQLIIVIQGNSSHALSIKIRILKNFVKLAKALSACSISSEGLNKIFYIRGAGISPHCHVYRKAINVLTHSTSPSMCPV